MLINFLQTSVLVSVLFVHTLLLLSLYLLPKVRKIISALIMYLFSMITGFQKCVYYFRFFQTLLFLSFFLIAFFLNTFYLNPSTNHSQSLAVGSEHRLERKQPEPEYTPSKYGKLKLAVILYTHLFLCIIMHLGV